MTALDDARILAEDNQLWQAADLMMVHSTTPAEQWDLPAGVDPLEVAAGWLELLDALESDGAEVAENTPPRTLRWAQWHTLQGQRTMELNFPGRAIEHFELAAGLFQSEGLAFPACPLLGNIAQCQLELDDVAAAEEALERARAITRTLPEARQRYRQQLDQIAAEIAAKI